MPTTSLRPRGSKALVIDASIVRASGGEDATHPVAKNCRDFLTDVLKICHRAVLTSELGVEWKRHSSVFARKWRVSMEAKKKIVRVADEDLPDISGPILDAIAVETQREAAEKDVHLVRAALCTDRIVVSHDERIRTVFSFVASQCREVAEVRWVNPAIEPHDVLNSLKPENIGRIGSLLGS